MMVCLRFGSKLSRGWNIDKTGHLLITLTRVDGHTGASYVFSLFYIYIKGFSFILVATWRHLWVIPGNRPLRELKSGHLEKWRGWLVIQGLSWAGEGPAPAVGARGSDGVWTMHIPCLGHRHTESSVWSGLLLVPFDTHPQMNEWMRECLWK